MGSNRATVDRGGAVIPWLSVVIPAFNEERRLPPTLVAVIAHLRGLGRPFEVIVADDGSSDGTARVAREAGPEVTLLRLPHRGKGAAVRDGVLASRGGLALVVDADLSTPIEELDRLTAALGGGCGVAIGTRRGPGSRVEIPQARRRRLVGHAPGPLRHAVRRQALPARRGHGGLRAVPHRRLRVRR